MCCPSAPAGYLLQAERLHYKGCVLFLACTRLYNDCYFRIGKMKILTPPDSRRSNKRSNAGRSDQITWKDSQIEALTRLNASISTVSLTDKDVEAMKANNNPDMRNIEVEGIRYYLDYFAQYWLIPS